MRRAARVDDNQKEIVRELRKFGASVHCLHKTGQGFPDLVIGWQGRNYLVEVKDNSKSPSARRLTRAESEWHSKWRGQVAIVGSVEEAITLLKIREKKDGTTAKI